MTPIYLIPHNSPFPLEEPNEDQQLQLCSPESQASSSSLHGGSTDHQFFPTTSLQIIKNDNENIQKFLICKHDQDREDNRSDHGSIKWMSSKMRLMKKMMNSGEEKPVKITHKFDTESSNILNIRTCSDCNTTKTPLWRSGPRGPKSLCNACGIRQRKARRASMAAGNGTQLSANISSVRSKLHQKEKKQCKTASSHGRKKICFEDFFLSMSENSAFKRVFPQDERDAAILLMALSCGLVHG